MQFCIMPSEVGLTSNFSPEAEALISTCSYSSFRPQGAILLAPSHTKLGFAIPLLNVLNPNPVPVIKLAIQYPVAFFGSFLKFK